MRFRRFGAKSRESSGTGSASEDANRHQNQESSVPASPIPIHLTLAADVAALGLPLAAAAIAVFVSLAGLAALARLREAYGGDLLLGLECRLARAYLALVHRIRFEGFDAIPELASLAKPGGGGLLVVANHTCGLDPMILQMPLRRRIRWMMWTGQMGRGLGWLWKHLAVLPVSQDGHDLATLRESLRALQRGEVIGVFPEGGVERPPGQVIPFQPGLGLLAVRSSAPILLCFIDGTPAPKVFGAFFVRSRSRVRAIGLLRALPGEMPAALLGRMQQSVLEASGWPLRATSPETAAPR
jgi:1-acyl-sn-glycerol-3-phosphate acyltransferase